MGSIRQVLESFVERTKQMYRYSSLNDHGEPLDEFEKEFQKLREETLRYRTEKTFAVENGEREGNSKKNRYKDILPYDYTRVVLSKQGDDPCSDYINANWVKGAMGQPIYIAAQGPMPATVVDFWRMMWEYEVNIVIMVCNEYEGRKSSLPPELKCQKYWAEDGESGMYGTIKVSLEREESTLSNCRVRHLKAEKNNRCRHLIQFHYTAWPDHGIPEQVSPILDMVAMVREYQPGDDRPFVVHCSAGCGRTGTVIAIDHCWNLLKMGLLNKDFRLFDVISEMRRQRPSFVQTKEQYMLVHKAVMELYQRHLDLMDEHIYTNMEAVGQLHTYTNTQATQDKVSTVYTAASEPISVSSPMFKSVERWVCQNKTMEPQHIQHRSPKQQRTSPTAKPRLSTGGSPRAQQRSSQPVAQPRKPPMSPKPRNLSAGNFPMDKPDSRTPLGAPTNPDLLVYPPGDQSSASEYCLAEPQARPRNSKDNSSPRPRGSIKVVPNKSYGMATENGQIGQNANSGGQFNGEYSLSSGVPTLSSGVPTGLLIDLGMDDIYNQPVDAVGNQGMTVYSDPLIPTPQKDPPSSPQGPPVPKKNLGSPDTCPPEAQEYSYADPNRADKWQLQSMAKELLENQKPGKGGAPRPSSLQAQTCTAEPYEPVNFDGQQRHLERPDLIPEAYSGNQTEPHKEVSPLESEYSSVQWRPRDDSVSAKNVYGTVWTMSDGVLRVLSSEDDAPPVPMKTADLTPPSPRQSRDDKLDKISVSSMDSSLGEKTGAVLKKIKNVFRGADAMKSATHAPVNLHSPVFFKGQDISYNKRVGKPVGPRSSNHAPIH